MKGGDMTTTTKRAIGIATTMSGAIGIDTTTSVLVVVIVVTLLVSFFLFFFFWLIDFFAFFRCEKRGEVTLCTRHGDGHRRRR